MRRIGLIPGKENQVKKPAPVKVIGVITPEKADLIAAIGPIADDTVAIKE